MRGEASCTSGRRKWGRTGGSEKPECSMLYIQSRDQKRSEIKNQPNPPTRPSSPRNGAPSPGDLPLRSGFSVRFPVVLPSRLSPLSPDSRGARGMSPIESVLSLWFNLDGILNPKKFDGHSRSRFPDASHVTCPTLTVECNNRQPLERRHLDPCSQLFPHPQSPARGVGTPFSPLFWIINPPFAHPSCGQTSHSPPYGVRLVQDLCPRSRLRTLAPGPAFDRPRRSPWVEGKTRRKVHGVRCLAAVLLSLRRGELNLRKRKHAAPLSFLRMDGKGGNRTSSLPSSVLGENPDL